MSRARFSAGFFVTFVALGAAAASAADLEGPARFCGYSPIIDLLPGEQVVTTGGGIHGGTFRWSGEFGELDVSGIGWASRPPGEAARVRTSHNHVRFRQRQQDGRYVVAIWNGEHGAAYFRSVSPLGDEQLAAIDRVDLYNEGEEPEGCDLRTIFAWGYD
ncbi:MAG: hypothetical protein HKN78_02465 [Sphingomonadaceae bacterium]|nr:hypothetical protein [Sphingomonadaceae bacterium]